MENMEILNSALQQYVNQDLFYLILSNPRKKDGVSKVRIRPVLLKDKLLYQVEEFAGKKAFHQNLEAEDVIAYVMREMENTFRQLELDCFVAKVTTLISQKGKATTKIKKKTNLQEQNKDRDLSHNRNKQYILEEGRPVPFLVSLGVQTADGKIVRTKYDKFRQINRYLEFVRDILPALPKDRTLTIIDFGCGKSYLTFALYHYLKVMNQYDIRVIGLDLKEDVIETCNGLSRQFGYDNLQFLVGDISHYEGVEQVDMVVTLHACDTATDYALEKAVKWGASVILSVPCCQHELNQKVSCPALDSIFQYGLIQERMAALMTDAIRANLLKEQGYETQILEFIDMEHTPKNILIRAVKRQGMSKMGGKRGALSGEEQKQLQTERRKMTEFLGTTLTLEKLLTGSAEETEES